MLLYDKEDLAYLQGVKMSLLFAGSVISIIILAGLLALVQEQMPVGRIPAW